jgi:hypothetical protein
MPVRVEPGESQVFEGKVPQVLDSVIGRKRACANLLEQLTDGVGIQ